MRSLVYALSAVLAVCTLNVHIAVAQASQSCTTCFIACMFEDDRDVYKEAFGKSSFRGWSLYILRNRVEHQYPAWGPACRFEIDFVNKETMRTTTIAETDLNRAQMSQREGIQIYKPHRSGPPYAFRLKVDTTKPNTIQYGYGSLRNEPTRIPDWYVLKASAE